MNEKKEYKLLYTIKELFEEGLLLRERNVSYFNIPHYQRGYKWVPDNVNRLLDDIDAFKINDDKFYCIQNITVIKSNDVFNVIDGQQRLTTLTILLSYLDQKSLVHNKVRFPENSIRKFTNQTLNNLITHNELNFYDTFDSWDSFLDQYPDYDLQDIYHVVTIAFAIKSWFEKKGSDEFKDLFQQKLLNNVKVIVNEVEGSLSEEKVFGNLNSKRIPLDGSDLVRAILITRVATEEAKAEIDLKHIIFVNERRIKLGWELDQINIWWSKKDVSSYFSEFLSIKSETYGDNRLFNESIYPINLLYSFYAEISGKDKLTLSFIEEQSTSAIKLFKEIQSLNYTLQDWYTDKEIYHFLGFLFGCNRTLKKKISLKTVWDLWQSSLSRVEFKANLKIKIEELIGDCRDFYEELSVNWYKDRQEQLVYTLLLMDVIEAIKDNKAKLPATCFKKRAEDIEHIFPQTPKDKKNDEIYNYTLFLIKSGYLQQDAINKNTLLNKLSDETFKAEHLRQLELATSKLSTNAIGNLVLLHQSLNRSIGNKSFIEKRSRIISYHNLGNYIQPHTFKVFVRDFISNKEGEYNDPEFWTQSDIAKNSSYVKEQVSNFFKN